MKNAEQPITPMSENEMDHSHYWGLTKREYFAGLAMQGMISSGNFSDTEIPFVAVQYANRILEELNEY
jgi:hypothetical protein